MWDKILAFLTRCYNVIYFVMCTFMRLDLLTLIHVTYIQVQVPHGSVFKLMPLTFILRTALDPEYV